MDEAKNIAFPQQLIKTVANNKKYFLGCFVVVLVLVLCITGLFFLTRKNKMNSVDSDILVKIENRQVFFPYVPNFDKLTIDGLPNISDIRGIFNYNDNLIIVALGNTIEYNPKSQTVIRQLDTNSVPCSYGAAKIGNYLYLACNGSLNSKDVFYNKASGIYVINLSTGILEKKYLPNKLTFANNSITSSGKTLWVGADNGVAKIDTTDDTIIAFTQKQLGFSGKCEFYNVYANDVSVWVDIHPEDGCSDGISLYNTNNNTWKSYWNTDNSTASSGTYTIAYSRDKIYVSRESNVKEQISAYNSQTSSWNSLSDDLLGNFVAYRDKYMPDARYLNNSGSGSKDFSYLDTKVNKRIDFNWSIADYLGLSNKVNNKYYLLTQNAIYILQRNGFPKLLKRIPPLSDITNQGKLLVDNNEQYLFFLVPEAFQDGAAIQAELLDIKNGTEWDLISNNPSYGSLSDKGVQTIEENISSDEYIYQTNDNGVDILDPKTKKLVMQLVFTRHTLNFK